MSKINIKLLLLAVKVRCNSLQWVRLKQSVGHTNYLMIHEQCNLEVQKIVIIIIFTVPVPPLALTLTSYDVGSYKVAHLTDCCT